MTMVDGVATVYTRVPPSLKAAIELVAAERQLSLNAWAIAAFEAEAGRTQLRTDCIPEPTRVARARRLAAQLENCLVDARAIGLHRVADAIEFARSRLVALALARLKIDLKLPARVGDLDVQ